MQTTGLEANIMKTLLREVPLILCVFFMENTESIYVFYEGNNDFSFYKFCLPVIFSNLLKPGVLRLGVSKFKFGISCRSRHKSMTTVHSVLSLAP